MKIIYLGTPEFAVAPLKALATNQKFEIQAVITQPDKPVGKKQILQPPAVKIAAEELNLPIHQPTTKAELSQILRNYQADFFIVIAYGMILSQEILDLPKISCINIHGSLLPKYRGASPIQETLLNGDEYGGITLIKMEKKMDSGPIYLIRKIPILPTDNYPILSEKLSKLSAEILPLALEDIAKNQLPPIKQDDSHSSFCHKINKEDGKIDWQQNSEQIINQLKAYTPWPGIYTQIDNKKLDIQAAERSQIKISPGTSKIIDNNLYFGTASGSIKVTKLQMEGKKSMETQVFLNGHRKLFEKD